MKHERNLATTDDSDPAPSAQAGAPTLLLVYCGGAPTPAPQPLPLRPGTTVLGRAPDTEGGLCIPENRVSRVHAVIHYEPAFGQLRVVDAGSRNGTSVNGARVSQCVLREDDILRLGDSLLLVRYQRPAEGEAGDGEEATETGHVSPTGLLGRSPLIRRLRTVLGRIAPSPSAVLLLGESGSGKEVAARYLHERSGRAGAFVAVNCSALPDSLVESQLFGHTRGAFTGAAPHLGFFRAAQGGTLLLDEIGDLSPQAQPKLLRVLEDRLVYPVGSVVGYPVDVRLLFATNRDLDAASLAGTFRGDLYARLAELTVKLPPLRARREDILLLLSHALAGRPVALSASLAEAMLLYAWPYNVREIYKLAAELAAARDDTAEIESRLRARRSGAPSSPALVPPTIVAGPSAPLADPDAPERERLVELLHEHRGNIAAVARTLSCPRKNVYRWVEQYRLSLSEYRS